MSGLDHVEAQVTVLMEDMHRAIRSASFEEVEAFSDSLETIFWNLPPLDRYALVRIRMLADRNAACLHAAAQGLRAGRRRLEEIAAAGRLDVYDRAGDRHALPLGAPGRRL